MATSTKVQIKARLESTCKRCGEKILPGEDITKEDVSGEAGRWVHVRAGGLLCEEKAAPRVRPEDVATPGVYEVDGVVFVVQQTKDKKRVYAKRIVELGPNSERLLMDGALARFDFVYDKGAIFKIRPEHRMSLERAKELMVRYGRCLRCGARLKQAQSVERGIGPVCIKYFQTVPDQQKDRDREFGLERDSEKDPKVVREMPKSVRGEWEVS